MKQIFIRIKKGESFYNNDMMNSSSVERMDWYNTLSKGQIMSVLEEFVTNNIIEENNIVYHCILDNGIVNKQPSVYFLNIYKCTL